MHDQQVNNLVAHLFRHEAGKMAAVLTRLFGFQSLDKAEDIVQETLLQAMSTWPLKGVPENPSAWLYTVAKRKAIDIIRQRKLHDQHHSRMNWALKSEWALIPTVNSFFLENEIEDSQLRMIFACCHPSIPYESRIALTLKTLCGLSISEIARCFLTNEETITKRLYRAREKIRSENVSLEAPAPAGLPERLDAVLHSLYLLFSEGYNSSNPDNLIRQDLCEEAIRLCLMLANHRLTNVPKTNALLSLMCFQASRLDARTSPDGSIILLRDQDRSRWFQPLIEKGKYYLEIAAEGGVFTEYHIEAAIAGCHMRAASFDHTDWQEILKLYDILMELRPDSIVQLNKAIATGYAISPEAGLRALQDITDLKEHYLYHSALGDFFSAIGDMDNASASYLLAKELTQSAAEKKLLQTKLAKSEQHKL